MGGAGRRQRVAKEIPRRGTAQLHRSRRQRGVVIIDIVVCVKQVPLTGEVEVDPDTGNLMREGVQSQTNPYDLFALEAAIALKERDGGRVTALSMGPPQAEAAVREALWMGADNGILLADREFAGADTLATSFTLAQAIRRLRYQLVLCGMQTTDGDTAQVGPELAEFLDIPHASYAREIRCTDAGQVEAVLDMGGDEQVVEIDLPCLLTVTADLNQPRLPSFRRKLETAGNDIPTWGRADLEEEGEPGHFGLEGSPTRVREIFPPESETEQVTWTGDPARMGACLARTLRELRFL